MQIKGRYIVLLACLMHVIWGTLLCFDNYVGNATPIRILFMLLNHSKMAVITLLWTVAGLAACFVNWHMRKKANIKILSFLLVPQQFILWISAGAGLYASYISHYADGTPCDWGHILADQIPISLLAFLYTIVLIQSRKIPFKLPSNAHIDITL